MPTSIHCQVLVAGGGPSGLAAGLALAEQGSAVLVADPSGGKAALNRCEMLPVSAEEILTRLGLAEVLAEAVDLNGVISLWGTKAPIDHGAASPGISHFGWSIDRARLDRAMRDLAIRRNVAILNARVRDVGGQPGKWCVKAGRAEITAEMLIDATGRPVAVARKLGAKTVFGPRMVAWTWSTDQDVPRNLLAEARPDGWAYSLPRPGGGGSIGYLTSRRTKRDPAPPSKPEIAQYSLVKGMPNADGIRAVDARSVRLDPMMGKGWLATGDAAAAFDPVSSQGLYNALSCGFFAGKAVADELSGSKDAVAVYTEVFARTAKRTHRMIPLQYAVQPYDTPFWRALTAKHSRNASDKQPALELMQ